MPTDPYGNVTTSTNPNWASNIVSNTNNLEHISWNGPIEVERLRLENLDLTAYTEAELRNFRDYLDAHLTDKYPPKPPKFASIEEADAWMEKHYGK
jgi:hypothetical protein